jgi:hypothetical protein
MLDESTNLKISHFYANKDGMVEPTCELIKKLKIWKLKSKFSGWTMLVRTNYYNKDVKVLRGVLTHTYSVSIQNLNTVSTSTVP